MRSDFTRLVDAVDQFTERLNDREAVVHAEVTGHHYDGARVVVTTGGEIRSATDINDMRLSCRIFAHGHADYRTVPKLSEDAMEDVIDRALRACKHTATVDHVGVDHSSLHRDVHDGWTVAGESFDNSDAIASKLAGIVADVGAPDGVDRTRFVFDGGRTVRLTTTTTGTAVRTTQDRARIDCTVVGDTSVREHVSGTTGKKVFRDLRRRLPAVNARASAAWNLRPAEVADERVDVVLSPYATARLVHGLCRYLEADTVLSGSAPFKRGDVIGPSSLKISDMTGVGSWGSLAYDAAGRPTTTTRLVSEGRVCGLLHDTTTAAHFDTTPRGNLLFATSPDDPPRIASRHLVVEGGEVPERRLRDESTVECRRLGEPMFENEATRTKRESARPPFGAYATRASEQTPSTFADEPDQQTLQFPVTDGYVLESGTRQRRLDDTVLIIDPQSALRNMSLGSRTATLSGTTHKHGSVLPLVSTAPSAGLDGVRITKT